MAQTARAEAMYKFGDKQFPIHYEGRYMRVYTNPSGELLVEDTRSGVSMRINPSHPGGLQFTTNGRVEAIQISNMIGWRIETR